LVIDFTAPEATLALARAAASRGKAMVIGTTGFSAQDLSTLKQATEKIGVVYATNFSTGVNLLWLLSRLAAQVLTSAYDVEIIEAHHNQKKDAPSGTAITLLEQISAGLGVNPAEVAKHGRQGMVGARPQKEIGLHAVRGGDIIGDHTVLFAGRSERLELKHQAHSRDTLAQGAARAADWLVKQPAGWYDMADVLGLKKLLA
jgi:4-hydroxy-tetrahydrodipicolinate reductase